MPNRTPINARMKNTYFLFTAVSMEIGLIQEWNPILVHFNGQCDSNEIYLYFFMGLCLIKATDPYDSSENITLTISLIAIITT